MCQGRRRAEARYVVSTEPTPTVNAQKTAVLTVNSFVNLGHREAIVRGPLTRARVSACSVPYLIPCTCTVRLTPPSNLQYATRQSEGGPSLPVRGA